jgi:toxin ParE1/3/4
MKVPVTFRNIAKIELAESAERYEQQKEKLGVDFMAHVKDVLQEIAANPRRYPIVFADVREGIVSKFPYCVYYRVKADRIVVTAVFHTSRDPAEWQKRI